jgi:hypothetical protein
MTRYDKVLIFFLIVAALAGILYTTRLMDSGQGNYAVIMVNREEYSRISLEDAEPAEFTVTSPWGYNTVEVGNNRVRIKAASCPDQICVKEGWIGRVNEMAVCIPNRFIIKIIGEETEIDDIAF